MGQYSIKELEKLSGIKAHTIRIWEKRHQIIQPSRTDTNIRFYSDDDLKKIIQVALLNNHGLKISKIAGLSREQLAGHVNDISSTHLQADLHIDQLVLAMIDLDEMMFEKIMADLILRYGFERAITEIVYPFLEKIGILWLTHNITPAQEHFISTLIRQKIIVAIDALPLAPPSAPGVLLYLPEQELHELGLLFYCYIVKKMGFRTWYLGQMVPYDDLISICNVHHPQFLICSITSSPSSDNLQAYLNKLCKARSASRILISGQMVRKTNLRKPSNLQIFSTISELKGFLLKIDV